ncbi:protein-glutamate O-methyltransferase CheR [Campylobacter sp. RM13119]|uniref:CheR family methyltransferase n=1 Tax=Campylobacter TaxID=194 RepID=UPI00147613EE|nr:MULTISPECIES: CheR family methyltransferase [unclassified Campylobacter]MBE3021582.1 protein-glutamate O-methyltransferase CheR [Campylobacter sp. 7477a]MBE3605799.1 protein-glutamate O-methyltransferase CheR [Campylobacter sp. RM13119]MBE3609914.1 protein-glutamate O-methyltransferase CheR [Campylobacter sp. RM12916]
MFFKRNSEQNLINTNYDTSFVAPSDMDGFNEFLNTLKTLCGVDLESKREIVLQRLKTFAKNRQIPTFKEIVNSIKYNKELRQDILNLITVNETYFYRELPQLKEVISYVKELGSARILCAPCSSGDEVYSLAMLAHEYALGAGALSVVGIDINSQAISDCISATYSSRSLHRLDNYQKERFFKKDGDKFVFKKDPAFKCEFKIMNVFDDAIFSLGKFDVILSRNMMIYFDDNFRLKCVERLHRLLKDGGRLYTGHADLVPFTPLYEKKFVHGSPYYQMI